MCIGTPQHLKSRFGEDYQLDCRLKSVDSNVNDILEFLQHNFDGANIIENYGQTVRFSLALGDIGLDRTFAIIEECKSKCKVFQTSRLKHFICFAFCQINKIKK